MNNIVITPRFDGDKFDLMLGSSLKNLNTKCVNVSDKDDSIAEHKMISNKYNVGIGVAGANNLINDDTLVILCKSDVSIADPNAIAKLEHVFTTQPNIGMVGVKGVTTLNKSVELYHLDNTPLNGIVYNVKDTNKGEYHGTDKKGYFTNIIAVDDSIMVIRGSILKNIEKLFTVDTNDGYGIEATVQVLRSGYGVAVIDMFVISNEYTDINSEIVEDICSKLNLDLPLSVTSLNVDNTFIVDVEV